MKYPYELIDGLNGPVVCRYKSLTIACREGAAKNKVAGSQRYFVRKVKSGRIVAC